jgi:lysophospholipase L1-like esterase
MRLLVSSMLLASLFSCQRAVSRTSAENAKNGFLALGDSYTIGESVDAADRWPVQLARMLREKGAEVADPQIIAATGWTTDELSAAMNAAEQRGELHGPFRMVALLIGVNNQFRGRGLDEFRRQFRDLCKRAVALAGDKAAHVFVVSIPDYGVTPFAASSDGAKIGRQIDQFNAVCHEEAGALGVTFVDITPISRKAAGDASLIAGDGLHPSGKMYKQWAEEILSEAQRAWRD